MQNEQLNPISNPATSLQGAVQPRGFPGLPKGWVAELESFPSADGTSKLFGTLFHPEDGQWKGHRALIIVHGIGEHGGRYLHWPHYLKDAVDCIFVYDQRGHGRSEGLRGHIEHFDVFADDLREVIRNVQGRLIRRFGQAEIHVLGHSMGSLVALRALFEDSKLPVSSCILSSPLLGIRVEVPLIKRMAAGTLAKLWGRLQMTSEVNPKDLSHDPEVAKAYVEDRLVHKKITPRLFTGMMEAIAQTKKRDSGFAYPLLMIVPGEDKVTDSDAAIEFFQALKHRDKSLKKYPSFFHESFNEIGKETAFEDLATWLKQHRNQN